MTLGSLLCGALLLALSGVESLWGFYLIWAGLGVGMALTLYEPAFALVVQVWPDAYRRRIGVLTLAGGLASTAFWPLTHTLAAGIGWRATVAAYAAVHLLICAPLHWLSLPRVRAGCRETGASSAGEVGPSTRAQRRAATRQALRTPAFRLLALSFVLLGFVTSAMATHVIAMLEDKGLAPATAIAIAALIGPMQMAGRAADLLLAGRLPPAAVGIVTVALFPAALSTLWLSAGAFGLLCAFAVMYGAGLGLQTIVRATAPAQVFGGAAYAAINGALSGPSILARAAGPLAGTYLWTIYERYDAVLIVLLACTVGGAAAYVLALRKAAS